MRNFKKLIGFMIVFMVVMVTMCTVSFAADNQYSEDLIPIMTSNTSPSGIASASSYSNQCYAWRAFDKWDDSSVANSWAATTTNCWLAYEFPSPKVITKYTLRASGYTQYAPRNWNFEAWDGSKWVILDTRNDVTGWDYNVKKDFYFTNTIPYIKYRINISSSATPENPSIISEMEMMESVLSVPSTPTNLISTAGNAKVDLSWDSTIGATSYNVKRATTAGGPYTTIGTSETNTYTDTGLTNGKTYYYVISAIVNGTESENSNEASATPTAPVVIGNSGILEITMANGQIKEYDLTATELDAFLTWYDNRSNGTAKAYYVFNKKSNIKPFLSRKEYISFDKISSFEVKEYAE